MTLLLNSSTNETLCLATSLGGSLHGISGTSLTCRKRVQFSRQLTVIQSCCTLSEEDRSLLWWQHEERLRFKCEIVLQSRALRQHPVHGVEVAVPSAEAISSNIKDECDMEESLKIVHFDMTLLQWCGSIYRGLENISSRLAKERNRRRASNLTKIAVLSARLTSDEIRCVAESHSRVDRILARMLGAADAKVISPYNVAELPRKSVARRLSFTSTNLPLRQS